MDGGLKRRTHGDGDPAITDMRTRRAQVGDEGGSVTMIRNINVVDNTRGGNAAIEARRATQKSAEITLGDGVSR